MVGRKCDIAYQRILELPDPDVFFIVRDFRCESDQPAVGTDTESILLSRTMRMNIIWRAAEKSIRLTLVYWYGAISMRSISESL